jgi:hypothetical protein
MNLTFKKYRSLDITIFTVLYAFIEALIVFGSNKWFTHQFYTLSLSVTIVTLVMVRWGGFAVIPACVGAVVYLLANLAAGNQVTYQTAIIYIGGSLSMMLGLLYIKLVTKEKLSNRKSLACYGLPVLLYIFTIIFRTLISMCFGYGFEIIVNYNFAECLTLLFALIAVFVARRQEGLFVDQKTYLLELEKKRAKERGGHIPS